jgi:malic enzyme
MAGITGAALIAGGRCSPTSAARRPADRRPVLADGLPAPAEYQGVTYSFGQASNALVYPGLGPGTILAGASEVADGMLRAASEAVAGQADVSTPVLRCCPR